MYLILHAGDERKDIAVGGNDDLSPIRGDGAGTVAFILHHTEHRDVHLIFREHLPGYRHMALPAIDQPQVGAARETLGHLAPFPGSFGI